jgi:hypothetical protein
MFGDAEAALAKTRILAITKKETQNFFCWFILIDFRQQNYLISFMVV